MDFVASLQNMHSLRFNEPKLLGTLLITFKLSVEPDQCLISQVQAIKRWGKFIRSKLEAKPEVNFGLIVICLFYGRNEFKIASEKCQVRVPKRGKFPINR
jgi:hypothetical protein